MYRSLQVFAQFAVEFNFGSVAISLSKTGPDIMENIMTSIKIKRLVKLGHRTNGICN